MPMNDEVETKERHRGEDGEKEKRREVVEKIEYGT